MLWKFSERPIYVVAVYPCSDCFNSKVQVHAPKCCTTLSSTLYKVSKMEAIAYYIPVLIVSFRFGANTPKTTHVAQWQIHFAQTSSSHTPHQLRAILVTMPATSMTQPRCCTGCPNGPAVQVQNNDLTFG